MHGIHMNNMIQIKAQVPRLASKQTSYVFASLTKCMSRHARRLRNAPCPLAALPGKEWVRTFKKTVIRHDPCIFSAHVAWRDNARGMCLAIRAPLSVASIMRYERMQVTASRREPQKAC